jgi:transposase
VAAAILATAYHVLRDMVPYRDLGPLCFTRLDRNRTAQRLARRSKELGMKSKFERLLKQSRF